ncbi:hypothetical protein ACP70R_002976 [Stipagrostis hirtigluma subsp. patula]
MEVGGDDGGRNAAVQVLERAATAKMKEEPAWTGEVDSLRDDDSV